MPRGDDCHPAFNTACLARLAALWGRNHNKCAEAEEEGEYRLYEIGDRIILHRASLPAPLGSLGFSAPLTT